MSHFWLAKLGHEIHTILGNLEADRWAIPLPDSRETPHLRPREKVDVLLSHSSAARGVWPLPRHAMSPYTGKDLAEQAIALRCSKSRF
jgi:hypothetical protein